MLKVKFLEPWRAYRTGELAELEEPVAVELGDSKVVEVIGGAPILSPTPKPPPVDKDESAVVTSLRRQLELVTAERDELLQKVAILQEAANEQIPDLSPAPPVSVPPAPADTGEAFPELDLPDATKQKMLDAGWKTTQDVIDFGNESGGLQSADGIGKVTEQAIAEAIKKAQLGD
ncbi:MAG: hypothetical protein AAGJ46_12150 [Planctomycetota bacterium]